MKTGNEVLFTDLTENVCGGKENILYDKREGKWRAMQYGTAGFSGKLLIASCGDVDKVTFDFGLMGMYKIYLGQLGTMGGCSTGIIFEKTGEKCVVDYIWQQLQPEYHWLPNEYLKEYFFTCCDMTDNKISLFKPSASSASVAFFRFVKMTEEEEKAFLSKEGGRTNYHFDEDYVAEADYGKPEEYLGRINMLKGSGGGILFYETSFDDAAEVLDLNGKDGEKKREGLGARELAYYLNVKKIREHIKEGAERIGFKMYAAYRMEMANFIYPFSCSLFNNVPTNDFKECRCETRDGKTTDILSYAYPQVRELALKKLLLNTDGFDGVMLIFHRGIYMAFEKPVRDAVQEKYGMDARRLPLSDERLNGVLCGFMNEFMRAVRKAMPDKKIHVIVHYDPESSRNCGLDIETWAREGLIDGVSQGIMGHYEDLEDCLGKDGLIDLEKFKAQNAVRFVTKRYFGLDANRDYKIFSEGSRKFLEICDKYGKEYYGSLGWESTPIDMVLRIVEEQKKAGVKKFTSWNSNHKAKRLDVLNLEKYISFYGAIDKNAPEFVKCYRILSVEDHDVSSYNPNWRG